MECGMKRKLPPWMSRTVSTSSTVEAEHKLLVDSSVKEKTVAQSLAPISKPKAKLTKKDRSANGSSEADSCLLFDNESTKKRRKDSMQGEGVEGTSSSIEFVETLAEKKKRNSSGRKRKTRRKQESPINGSNEEIDSPLAEEDDGELTVEDMMIIAQEYVRNDENMGPSLLSNEFDDGKSSNGLPTSAKEIVTVHNATVARTGDPAQDMLDLFLGPLLKKSRPEDESMKIIQEEDRTSSYGGFKEFVENSNVSIADFVPVTKKKSSLKDKVAMFF